MKRITAWAIVWSMAAGLLHPAAEAQVYNLHLATDNQPDYTDMKSFVESSTGAWQTPQEKAIAVWRWGRRSRRQLSCSREGTRFICDPILNYNSYGALNCGIISVLNICSWLELGYQARYVQLGDHTVSEVSWDGGRSWHLFDSSMSFFCYNHEGQIASCEEIKEAHGCAFSGGKVEPGHYYLYHPAPQCATHLGPDGWRCASDNPVEFARTLANPDADGRELTTGIIIAPAEYTGTKAVQPATAFWDSGALVTFVVDLGGSQSLGGVRVATHQPDARFCHPRRVEVSVAEDGARWEAAGVIRHDDLWNPPGDYEPWEWDDHPKYAALPAGGRLAYPYPLAFAKPVRGRYVRFVMTPLAGKGMGVSELQVFDRVEVTPWSAEIVLPNPFHKDVRGGLKPVRPGFELPPVHRFIAGPQMLQLPAAGKCKGLFPGQHGAPARGGAGILALKHAAVKPLRPIGKTKTAGLNGGIGGAPYGVGVHDHIVSREAFVVGLGLQQRLVGLVAVEVQIIGRLQEIAMPACASSRPARPRGRRQGRPRR